MTISSEYQVILNDIAKRVQIPLIKEIIVPAVDEKAKKSNFAAIILEDNSIGIFFVALTREVKKEILKIDSKEYKDISPMDLVKNFTSNNLYKKSLSMGAINAISQFFFKKTNFSFDHTSDSLGLLNIYEKDIVGMVGFFPPLVKKIEERGNKLVIIELKEDLVKKEKNWVVTLDPTNLEDCNKVLLTSTTILNDTIDDILKFCSNAEKTSIIGPTAGFLPDPLFKRGINVVGGTRIINAKGFLHNIRNNIRWGSTTKKYSITRENYSDYLELLKNIH
ncbi:MAG: hypothetical protein EU529_06330 [Promethearchaeota archaeon]|nr:MAG: hypothetical protein EU529_06330 [Candidatus Lokiarchaeota archaeon]